MNSTTATKITLIGLCLWLSSCGGSAPSLDEGDEETSSNHTDSLDSQTFSDSNEDTSSASDTVSTNSSDSDSSTSDTVTETQHDTASDSHEDTTTVSDGPCPFECDHWTTCLDAGGEVEASFTCIDPAKVCCRGADIDSESGTPDTASDTNTNSKPDCDPDYTCTIVGTCKLLGGLPHDEMTCINLGGGVCCEFPEDTDSNEEIDTSCSSQPSTCGQISPDTDVQYLGCCWDNVIYWCEFGVIKSQSCSDFFKTCSWSETSGYVVCI